MLTFDLTRNLPQHRLRFCARLPNEPTTSVLCGANGSGKSLLLSMLAGVEKPDRGEIAFDGRLFFDARHNLPPERRRIGYAFQEARLFSHMSVAKNLDYARRMRKASPRDNKERDAVIDAFALAPLLARSPSRLSGGEQQRVALARTLLSDPLLLLLDEPLSSLDRRHRRKVLEFLHAWLREKNLPCLYVSHEIEEVACLATHALVVALVTATERDDNDEDDENRLDRRLDSLVRSEIASSSPIEIATTALETSRQTGASPTAVVPVVVQEQRALDGLWRVAFVDNPDISFHLSTHKGAPPTLLDAHAGTTHARIRAEDILLTEHDDRHGLVVELLAFAEAHDGSHTAQIICANQRLLMHLSPTQAQSLRQARTKNCRVRIRKAQGGIL